MIKKVNKRILSSLKLSVLDYDTKNKLFFRLIEDFSFDVYSNEIVAFVTDEDKMQDAIAKSIAGLRKFVAEELKIAQCSVVDYSKSREHGNGLHFNKPPNVNYISDEIVMKFNSEKTPTNFLVKQIFKREYSQIENKINELELNLEFLRKVMLINDLYKTSEVKIFWESLQKLTSDFESLVTEKYTNRLKNDNPETHYEVFEIEKNYLFTIEKIKERINEYQSDLVLVSKKHLETVNARFVERIETEKLKLELLRVAKDEKVAETYKKMQNVKNEMNEDFADLHKSHLKERKEFLEKSFRDEKEIHELEFKKKASEYEEEISNLKVELKKQLDYTKRMIHNRLNPKFQSEISKLQKELKITTKEFIRTRDLTIKKIYNNAKYKQKDTKAKNQSFEFYLIEFAEKCKKLQNSLIDKISNIISKSESSVILRLKIDQIILDWKKMQTITNLQNKKNKKNAQLMSAMILYDVGLKKDLFHTKIIELNLIDKVRVLIAQSFFNNNKITIFHNLIRLIPTLQRQEFWELVASLSQWHLNSVLLFEKDFNFLNSITDRFFVVKNNKMVETGLNKNMLKNPVHPFARTIISETFNLDEALEKKPFQYFDKDKATINDNSISRLQQVANEEEHLVFANEREFQFWQKHQE